MLVEQKCLKCEKSFQARSQDIKRGYGKFCCQSCASSYNGVKVKEPNCICAFCNTRFYKSPSRKLLSKSGLMFCCRKCKDTAQRIESKCPQIHPPHYNDGMRNYRAKALKEFPHQCNRCAYDKHPEILQVHHKDHNRENNSIENLEIVCPNCHAIEHLSGPAQNRTEIL